MQQFLDKKWLKNSVRKQFLPKVAETLVESCSCQDGLNRFKPRFKPVLAETCQPWVGVTSVIGLLMLFLIN